jgi:L-ascorbate metabolism protein UlaG (beta-lactamase superfamily)
MNRLTWHGHSCFTLETTSGHRLMLDPWLDENPSADIRTDQVKHLDFVLCSHGHSDHFADAIPLCRETGATLLGAFELVAFAQSKGVRNAHALHIGGGHHFPFGYAKMTPAMHGGQVAGDEAGTYTTHAGGWWLDLAENSGRLYHAGDTALMLEMQLLKGKVDVALLPIGDNYTMGPDDAVQAVEFIAPRTVIPMHYNTFDLIKQDPHAFARRVGERANVHVLEPGQSYEF